VATTDAGASAAAAGAALLHAWAGNWPSRPAGLSLREETDADIDFVRELYASTRAEEMARVDWSDQARAAFVEQQFTAQRTQYRQHYPSAAFVIIECEGERIGRFYLDRTRSELRLMEITLLPSRRAQGLGTALLGRLLDFGDALGLPVSLHVEPFNPAHRLYARLGFDTIEIRGVYHFMQRQPGTPMRSCARVEEG
jgi:GNAT superfamily N-acetyltransferase